MLIPDSALVMLHRLGAGELYALNDYMGSQKETGDQWVVSFNFYDLAFILLSF
jgi:hypothetical protein